MAEVKQTGLSFGEALKFAALGDDIWREEYFEDVYRADRRVTNEILIGKDPELRLRAVQPYADLVFEGKEYFANDWIAETTDHSV